MTTIGDRFKIIRMDNDFSQTNFAKLLGVSLSAYKNYELNKTPVPHTVLEIMRKEFKVSLDWLVSGMGPLDNVDNILKEYYDYLNKNKYSISFIDVLKRLAKEAIKIDKDNQKEVEVFIKNNDLNSLCKFLCKYYNEIDFYKYYNENKIPYSVVLMEDTYNGLSSDYILYGIWDANEINDKTSELRSIINLYLTSMSQHALEHLKNKLEELRKLEKDFFQ